MGLKHAIGRAANFFGYSVARRSTFETLLRESRLLREQAAELAALQRANLAQRLEQAPPDHLDVATFDFDGLRNDPRIIHNHDFMTDPAFVAAYRRGVAAAGVDYKYYWRVHVALWCASHALTLPGDFVECGVWKGVLSSAIMTYLDWNRRSRRFFLFDTFRGIDERQLTDAEIAKGNISHFRAHYQEDIYPEVVRNFAEFENVTIVRGSVPETLAGAGVERVCYLSIDMNNAAPEIAAATYFWDRLVPGAPILLDDYGFVSYEVQKAAFDRWAAERGVKILALPTGQGLILKPGKDGG